MCLLTALSACASAGNQPLAVKVVDSSCSAYRQISWSVDDSLQTVNEVRQHNRTHAELCKK
jgi:hypothetical protein